MGAESPRYFDADKFGMTFVHMPAFEQRIELRLKRKSTGIDPHVSVSAHTSMIRAHTSLSVHLENWIDMSCDSGTHIL